MSFLDANATFLPDMNPGQILFILSFYFEKLYGWK